MSDLIKEAIADAKAVREMAVKQARAALEEAFAPQVDAIITKRLQTEMDEEEDEFEDEAEVEEAISPAAGVELGTDNDHEKAKENSGLTEVEDTSGIGTSDNKEPSKQSSEETTEDPGGEQELQGDHDDAKENSGLTEEEEMDEDVDLEEIVRELEEEADSIEEDDDFEEEGEEEDDEMEVDVDGDGDADVAIDVDVDDEGEVGEEEEEVDEDLNLEIEDDEEEYAGEEEGEEDDLDLEGIMDEVSNANSAAELSQLQKENSTLKTKLGEAMKVVKIQKGQLNEINILNAKLLFTNKVFSNFNLDDSSKLKVIENFDRAKSVREIKLIFATLMENMNADKKKITSKAQRLVEGASKAIGSTQSKKAEENIIEEQDEIKSRVHKLMGLGK